MMKKTTKILAACLAVMFVFCACTSDDRRLVFLGDSITKRWDVARMFPTHVCCNKGVMLSRITDWAAHDNHYPDDIVILWLGTNDITSDKQCPALIQENYTSLLHTVKAAKIIVLAIPPRGEESLNPIIRDANKRIADLCASLGISFVDAYTPLEKNGFLNPEYSADKIHINEQGLKRIASDVMKHL